MPKINVLEVRILEHCNYKCISCGAFSNIAEKEDYDLNEYTNDLSKIKHIFGGVNTFRIYGGEPLMSKRLNEYVTIARSIFDDAIIEIVTNGLLIRKKDESFFNLLKDNNIKIVVSYYGDNQIIVDKGISIIKEKNIDLEIIPIKHFYVVQDFNQQGDSNYNRKMCVVSIATYLHHGRIYPCPYPFSYRHYDKIYETSYYNPEVGIDIHKTELSSRQILKKLNEANDFCKYCKGIPGYVDRKQGQPGSHDWFCSDKNPHLLKNYSWYDFLKEVDKLVYNIITFEDGKFVYKTLKENELKVKKNIYIWIEDEYGGELFNRIFIMSAKNMGIDYSIIHFQSDSREVDINKMDWKNKNFIIILLCDKGKSKVNILKYFNKNIKIDRN